MCSLSLLENISQLTFPVSFCWELYKPADGNLFDKSIFHPQEQLSVSNSLTSMTDMAEAPSSPLGATDSTDDSDEEEEDDSEIDDWEPRRPPSFNPHSLCE